MEIREVLLTAVRTTVFSFFLGVLFFGWSSLGLARCEMNQTAVLSLVFLKGLQYKAQQCSSFCCSDLVAVGSKSFLLSLGWFNTEVKHPHAKPVQLTRLNTSTLIRRPRQVRLFTYTSYYSFSLFWHPLIWTLSSFVCFLFLPNWHIAVTVYVSSTVFLSYLYLCRTLRLQYNCHTLLMAFARCILKSRLVWIFIFSVPDDRQY